MEVGEKGGFECECRSLGTGIGDSAIAVVMLEVMMYKDGINDRSNRSLKYDPGYGIFFDMQTVRM